MADQDLFALMNGDAATGGNGAAPMVTGLPDAGQVSLFGDDGPDWRGMPPFEQKDLQPYHSILVHFKSREDMEAFSQLVGQRVNTFTRFLWHPEAERALYADKRWVALSLNPPAEQPPQLEEAEPE